MAYGFDALSWCDLKQAYAEAKGAAARVAWLTSQSCGCDPGNLRVYDIMMFEEEENGVEFQYVPFTGSAKRIMAGSLMVGAPREGLLPYAQVGINDSMVTGRQNYTALHEIIHYHVDVPQGYKGESFSSLLNHGKYSPEEQFREARSNFGAAILHIPLQAMVASIKAHKDLREGFSSEFATSYGNSFTRVRNFLVMDLNIKWAYANRVVDDYRADPYSPIMEELIDKIIEEYPLDIAGVRLDGDHSVMMDFNNPFE